MTKDWILEFVEAIIATGCLICTIGHDSYLFTDEDIE